jgi:hypothetical protein
VIRKIIYINSGIVVLLAVWLFIYPPVRAFLNIDDTALRQPGVPKVTWRLYRNLTPRYAAWAKERVAQGQAEKLSTQNISGTEWPLFGSVFYLWGVENLQLAWEGGDHRGGAEPKVFARDAIIAASELVIDPKHASWVKTHWGEGFLHRENVFYRMLVMAALTSRAKLLHDNAHLDMLRDQVESLASELDASNSGLLDDYPGECYPGDVMTSVACIQRADGVLGTDHSKFVARALRAFIGDKATRLELPPYMAHAVSGKPVSVARGCANSYMCLAAPELWPNQARQWYQLYDRFFWQQRITAVGYREYPLGLTRTDWTMDVDSGPVIAGHGVSASAFGMGAARKNGRFDRAYPLACEMLATVWELPNGVLGVPRLLSNLSDAPMLGEAAVLWLLTIQPEKGFAVRTGGSVPTYVYVVLISALLFGLFLVLEACVRFKAARQGLEPLVWMPRFQFAVWACLLAGGLGLIWTGFWWAGFILMLLMLMLPFRKKAPSLEEFELAAPSVSGKGPG